MQKKIDNALMSKEAMNLIGSVEQPFKGLPHLPKGLMEFLVGIAPWVAGIVGVMNLLGAYQSARLAMDPNPYGEFFGEFFSYDPTYYWIMTAGAVLMGLLLIMAFKPLKARQLRGWVYLFWVNILSIVQSLAGIALIKSNLIMSLIWIAIGLYFLFEFKPYYKSSKKGKK